MGTSQYGLQRREADKEALRITPYVSVGVSAYTGLGQGILGPDGKPQDLSAIAYNANAGLNGAHAWRRDLLGITFNTSYFGDTKNSRYNGMSETLGLAYTHELDSRTRLSLTSATSTGNRAYGMPGGMGLDGLDVLGVSFTDPNSSYLSNNELVDARIYNVAASTDLSRNLGRDWAVSLGGTGFTILRNGSSLLDVYGASARAQVSRRVGRHTSFGFGYSFSNYAYNRQIGDMATHSVSLSYSRQIGRRVHVTLQGGAIRVERLSVRTFTVDPALQALLGISTSSELMHGLNYFGSGGASISRSFRRQSLSLNYTLRTSPGNGVYAGVREGSAYASYGYSGFRNWGLSASGGYTRYSSLMIQVRSYEGYSFTGGVSRQIWSSLSASLNGGFRHTVTGNNSLMRDYGYASFSIAYSPRTVGLPGWW